jgi:hypothetical protein
LSLVPLYRSPVHSKKWVEIEWKCSVGLHPIQRNISHGFTFSRLRMESQRYHQHINEKCMERSKGILGAPFWAEEWN